MTFLEQLATILLFITIQYLQKNENCTENESVTEPSLYFNIFKFLNCERSLEGNPIGSM